MGFEEKQRISQVEKHPEAGGIQQRKQEMSKAEHAGLLSRIAESQRSRAMVAAMLLTEVGLSLLPSEAKAAQEQADAAPQVEQQALPETTREVAAMADEMRERLRQLTASTPEHASQMVFDQRMQSGGTGTLEMKNPEVTQAGQIPVEGSSFVLSGASGYLTADLPGKSNDENRFAAHLALYEADTPIESTGTMIDVSGVGDTQDRAILSALREASSVWGTQVDSSVVDVQRNNVIGGETTNVQGIVDSAVLRTESPIFSYSVQEIAEKQDAQGNSYFEVQLSVEQGVINS